MTLGVSGAVGSTPGSLLVSPGPPVGQPIGPCTVEIDLSNFVILSAFTTDAQGGFTFTTTLPNDPAIIGTQLTLQAAIAPSTGPLGADITNGLDAVIGN